MKKINLINDEKRSFKRIDTRSKDIINWLEIWENGRVYFDGKRDQGYGGYVYDGRWTKVVEKIINLYKLSSCDNLLDIGCAKGFLVNDYNKNKNVGLAKGFDISMYALFEGKKLGMEGEFICGNTIKLPFKKNEFTFVFCKDTLHNILNKKELILALKEIQRVGQKSWVRVGAYENDYQKKILDEWATFATSYFHIDEWYKIFEEANFTGDFDWFHPTENING